MASSAAPIQARPYRSHRVPACIRCRSRKIRCHIDIPGEPCLSCRERRLKCQYADAATPPDENGDPRRHKRRRTSNGDGIDDTPARPRSAPILHKPTSNTSASIILAPHVAEDVDILHRHIWQHQKTGPESTDQYQTLSHNTHDPIVYLTVPRFRTGLRPEIGCGKEQLEIVAQIMGPFKREVIDLYFTHHHYHFPILDDDQCLLLRKGEIDKIPNNLLCVVYAMSMPHWRKSDTLKMHPRPDHYYIWNKAISAILEDFLSPGMSTIAAALLDQIGRPSVSIVGNITLCGRTIALAQTFGLHRDPSKWQITEAEKSVRMRLWWGVLITDYWASMGYGKPPNIAKGYYDVPRPTLNALITTKATITQKCAATCFIHLYTLTELLGEILPMVYEIDPDRIELSRSVERLKGVFNDLESDLPEWMPLPNRPGTSNLWLCFLSIKLLLSRVTLRATILEGDTRLQKTRLDELRNTSSAVLDFVLSLSEPQFNDFWLPHTTHLLVHAITVSLRCTAETQDPDYRNTSIVRLQRVIAHIQDAHDNLDWDIAVYCLERCSEPVARIASLINAAPTVIETAQTQAQQQQQQQQKNPQLQQNLSASADTAADPHNLTHSSLNGISSSVPGAATGFGGPGSATGGDTQSLNTDDAAFLLSDILDPNAFDFSWEALWDTPSGMTNFSI